MKTKLLAEQTKYSTEKEARIAARTLGNIECQIIESKDKGQKNEGPWIYYLEHGDVVDNFMIRFWERSVYNGKGKNA